MDEQVFQKRADAALSKLSRELIEASDDYGFDVDFNGGVLTVEFEQPQAKFVVSPNTPPRQIWVSALTRSYKLSWDVAELAFVLEDTGETLKQLMARAIGQQLGKEVDL